MTALIEMIYQQALDLPTYQRLYLIDKLLHSTNLPIQTEIDEAWVLEARKRTESLKNGTSRLIPGNEVFDKIKIKFSR